jgi:hypothetical protein
MIRYDKDFIISSHYTILRSLLQKHDLLRLRFYNVMHLNRTYQ